MDLIVTCPRHFEEDAAKEVGALFERFGMEPPGISITGMPGILTVETGEDPVRVAGAVAGVISDEPWSVRYSQRIIPIHREVGCDVAGIVGGVRGIMHMLGEGHTYRITVEKRDSGLSSREIISEVAGIIPNRVSLKDPDRVVLVEILGSRAGVSVVRPDDVVSVERRKRRLSEED